VVEHEVLAAKAPRMAITVWLYGRPTHTLRDPGPRASPLPDKAMAALASFLGQPPAAEGKDSANG
jgi:hypothetical protein